MNIRNLTTSAARIITSPLIVTSLIVMATHSAGISAASAGDLPAFASYDEILLQNVRNGYVDYDRFSSDGRFESFIEQLGAADVAPPETDEERLALYINAYNAFAIQGILNGESPATWWGRRSFFKRQKYSLNSEIISLETLEHERIIPIGDPRIHFAIVCASLSCPRLSSNAYRAESINVQLHDAAKRFINDSTRNRFDLDRRIAFLSKIFEWYAEDFEAAGGSTQRYLARFVNDAQVQDALRSDEFELRYLEYDWNLNGRLTGKD
jgi:hypothetical protein